MSVSQCQSGRSASERKRGGCAELRRKAPAPAFSHSAAQLKSWGRMHNAAVVTKARGTPFHPQRRGCGCQSTKIVSARSTGIREAIDSITQVKMGRIIAGPCIDAGASLQRIHTQRTMRSIQGAVQDKTISHRSDPHLQSIKHETKPLPVCLHLILPLSLDRSCRPFLAFETNL